MYPVQQPQKEPRQAWQPESAWELREANAYPPSQQVLQGPHQQQSTPSPPVAVRSVSENTTSAAAARPPNDNVRQEYKNMDGINNNSSLSSRGKKEEDAIEIDDSDDDEAESQEAPAAARTSTSNTVVNKQLHFPDNNYATTTSNHGSTSGNNHNNGVQISQASAAAKPRTPVNTERITAFQIYVREAPPGSTVAELEKSWQGLPPFSRDSYEDQARLQREQFYENERLLGRSDDTNFANGMKPGAAGSTQSNRGDAKENLGSPAHRNVAALAAHNSNNDGNSFHRNASSTSSVHANTPPSHSIDSDRCSSNNPRDVVEIDDDDSEVEFVKTCNAAPNKKRRGSPNNGSPNTVDSSIRNMPVDVQSELGHSPSAASEHATTTPRNARLSDGYSQEGRLYAHSAIQSAAVGKKAAQPGARRKPDPPLEKPRHMIKKTKKQHSDNPYLDKVEVICCEVINLCGDSDDDAFGSNRNRGTVARAKKKKPTNQLTPSRKSKKHNGRRSGAANSRPATPYGKYDPSRGRAGSILNRRSPDPDGKTPFGSEEPEKMKKMRRHGRQKRSMTHSQHERSPRRKQIVHREQPFQSNGIAGGAASKANSARATLPSGSGEGSRKLALVEQEVMDKADRLLAQKRKRPSRPQLKTWTAEIKARMDEPCQYDVTDFDSMILTRPDLWDSLASRGMDGDTCSATSLNSSQVSSTDTSSFSGEDSDGDKKPRAKKTPTRRADRKTHKGSKRRTEFESDFDCESSDDSGDCDTSDDDSGCSEEVEVEQKEDNDLEDYRQIIRVFEHRQGNTIGEIEKSKVVRSDKKLNSNKQYGKITDVGMKVSVHFVF